MLTVLGVLIAIAPFDALFGGLVWASRRERLRQEVRARQVAVTDCIHERLGAVAAPVVRRHRGLWQVSVAVPFEHSALTEAILTVVLEAFAPHDRDRRSLEIVLTRQLGPSATKSTSIRSIRRESPSWT